MKQISMGKLTHRHARIGFSVFVSTLLLIMSITILATKKRSRKSRQFTNGSEESKSTQFGTVAPTPISPVDDEDDTDDTDRSVIPPLPLLDENGDKDDGVSGHNLTSFLETIWSSTSSPVEDETRHNFDTTTSGGDEDDTVIPTSAPVAAPPTTPFPTPVSNFNQIPTESPTRLDDFLAPNPIPDELPEGYFQYNPDELYGPDYWQNVSTVHSYFEEFGDNGFGAWKGHLSKDFDPAKNRCGKEGKQSPIDLWPTEGEGGECLANHEIRTREGTYRVSDDHIQKKFEGHKLSLVLNRRPCLDLTKEECRDNPPIADYPTYSSGATHNSDLLNFDIKTPSEHHLEGEQFDAEIQMMHTHQIAARVATISVLIRAKEDGYNDVFQDILDEFQGLYDLHKAQCEALTQARRLGEPVKKPLTQKRSLQRPPRFNPYHESIMRTIFFYRYNGSTTDPPCFPITWFVMTEPMIISDGQLAQIKRLLFTHVDGQCHATSVHYDQSVARPLQDVAEKNVTKCEKGDFVADADL